MTMLIRVALWLPLPPQLPPLSDAMMCLMNISYSHRAPQCDFKSWFSVFILFIIILDNLLLPQTAFAEYFLLQQRGKRLNAVKNSRRRSHLSFIFGVFVLSKDICTVKRSIWSLGKMFGQGFLIFILLLDRGWRRFRFCTNVEIEFHLHFRTEIAEGLSVHG